MGVGRLIRIDDLVLQIEKAVANGVATLDNDGKIPKPQLGVTIEDVEGAITVEVDPTVPSFTKGLSSSNAVLSAVNAASGTLASSLIPFSISNYIPTSQKATAGGVASLDGSGKVPKTQISLTASDVGAIAVGGETDPTVPALAKTLTTNDAVLSAVNAATGLISANRLPSYVDDVLSYSDLASFPATGETAKIYVAEDSGKIYRWSGSSYIEILSSAGNTDTATKLATPRTISATGDGSWSVSFDGSTNATSGLTLATVNLSPGSFGSATQTPVITVDAKGRITTVSNTTITPAWESVTGKPTTLSGFGITDAQPLGNELSALQALADGTGFLRKVGDGSYSIDTSAYLPLTGGTVTGSITATSFVGSGASLTNITADAATKLVTARTISASGDAVWSVAFDGTANATDTLTLSTVNSNTGTFGSATQTPVFIVDGKGRITQVSNTTITPAWGSITGVPATLTTIAGLTATNKFVIVGNGTTWTARQIDVSADITGVLPIANGGTGSSSAPPANRIMLSNFSSSSQLQWDNTNKYLGVGTGTPAYPLDVFGVGRVSGQLLLTNTTISTSPTTGAEVISGGLGVAGAIYSGGGFNGSGAGLTDLNASNVTSGKMGYAFLNIAENATISNDNTPTGGTILTNLAEIARGYPYDNAHLFSVSHSASRGFQVINSMSGANFSFRSRNGGAWTAWRQVITSYRDDGTGVFISTGGTGWTAATGTATRTTFATDTVTLIELARRVKALIDDLLSRGIIA